MAPMREHDVRRALAEMRKRSKLTQKQVAKRVEHAQSWVSDHESGKREMTIDDAHALGVEVTEDSSDAAWFAWDSAWQQLAEKIAAKAAE